MILRRAKKARRKRNSDSSQTASALGFSAKTGQRFHRNEADQRFERSPMPSHAVSEFSRRGRRRSRNQSCAGSRRNTPLIKIKPFCVETRRNRSNLVVTKTIVDFFGYDAYSDLLAVLNIKPFVPGSGFSTGIRVVRDREDDVHFRAVGTDDFKRLELISNWNPKTPAFYSHWLNNPSACCGENLLPFFVINKTSDVLTVGQQNQSCLPVHLEKQPVM